MNSNKAFDHNYFFIDSLPSEKKDERIIRYLPRLIKSIIALMFFWIFFWIYLQFWYMVYLNIFMMTSLYINSLVLEKKKVSSAMHLLILTSMIYVVFTCVIISGTGGIHLGSVHYWMLALIVVVHFVFSNDIKIRCFYTMVSIGIILIFEYALISFEPIYTLNADLKIWAHSVTILSVILTIVFFLHLLVTDYNCAEESLGDSNDRMEKLLFNILPPKIAKRLKDEGHSFADGFLECSILFADLAGFTSWADGKQPEEVVAKLNQLFSKFDDLCDEFNIEKIKTIGDAYMVAAGVPEEDPDHAYNITRFALKMKQVMEKESFLNLRIGINSGIVVAGIIGKKRLLYDLWGDSVNVASRMESSCEDGEIQISKATYERIKNYDSFEFVNKRTVYVKGKGNMETYLIKEKIESKELTHD